jgi:xanthine dehydrogenase iron-sulfur cluster and FAD-binding subunit A
MAAAIATLAVGNSWDNVKCFVGGLVTVSASPATYTTGGIAFNLNQSDVKAQRTPSDVQIQRNFGICLCLCEGYR